MAIDEEEMQRHMEIDRVRRERVKRMEEQEKQSELKRLAKAEKKRRTRRRDRIAEALFLALVETQHVVRTGVSTGDLLPLARFAYAAADALESARPLIAQPSASAAGTS